MGPLHGIKVLEFAGIGPGPFCGMLLADMGAEVIRIDRPNGPEGDRRDIISRGRRSLVLDLKNPAAITALHRMITEFDVLIEGFRPGVMERLGLGPDEMRGRHAKLIYGRMTGWGQDGPLALRAGHDINYIALTGALHAMGRPDAPPAPPLNLIGDYGGGGMLLALGILAALLERAQSGQGQVVDAAMVDGAALLMAPLYGMKARGRWHGGRGGNLLDGSASFYDTYACACGGFVAVGPIEPQFFTEMLTRLGLDEGEFQDRMNPANWSADKAKLAAVFRTRTRDAWAEIFAESDGCVVPVLSMDEAPHHPHNQARGNFRLQDGVAEPTAAPRFSRSQAKPTTAPPLRGDDNAAILRDFGFSAVEIEQLLKAC